MRSVLFVGLLFVLAATPAAAQEASCWTTDWSATCSAGGYTASCIRQSSAGDWYCTETSAPLVQPAPAPRASSLGTRWFAELERNIADTCRAYRGLGCP